MGRIRKQQRAGNLQSGTAFPAGKKQVGDHAEPEQSHAHRAEFRGRGAAKQAAHCGTENFPRTKEQQAGDDDGGKNLEFAVAVGMSGVGWPGGGGDADQGDDAGSAIEQGVNGVGKDAQAAQLPADAKLDGGQKRVDSQGGE